MSGHNVWGARLGAILKRVKDGEMPGDVMCVMVTTTEVASGWQMLKLGETVGRHFTTAFPTAIHNEKSFTDVMFDCPDKTTAMRLARVIWGKGFAFVKSVRVGFHHADGGVLPHFFHDEEGCGFQR